MLSVSGIPGSTVNMNIMGPVYDLVKKSFDGPSYQVIINADIHMEWFTRREHFKRF